MIPPVVDAAWLAAHGERTVLADVRFYLDGRSGRAAHEAGHVPGAVFVDLADRLAAHHHDETAGRHPLPDATAFAEGLSALGIGDGDLVVAYDDAGGVMAARLVWMLRATGHDAALLDGGLGAWKGPLQTGPVVRAPATLTPRPWPAELVADVADATDRDNVVLDARPADRYAGAPDALDPRAGHIPGSRSLPCREHLDSDGRLLDVDRLRARFAAVGVTGEQAVVSSCGSGVTACHNLLVMEHAGLPPGRLYPGSWSAYSRDPTRPVATGDAPG